MIEQIAHFHFQTVHFPIALTLASFLLMILGLLKRSENLVTAGRYLLYLATLGAIAAVTTGLLAEEYIPHSHEGEIHEVMEWHETLGLTIAGGLVLTSILSILAEKKKWNGVRKIIFVLLFVLSSAIAVTGFLGGRLGHEFGIGIKKEEAPTPSVPATSDKGEEPPMGTTIIRTIGIKVKYK